VIHHFAKAMIAARVNQEFEVGLFHFERAIALNRNYAKALLSSDLPKDSLATRLRLCRAWKKLFD
jgi:hypothetical protein